MRQLKERIEELDRAVQKAVFGSPEYEALERELWKLRDEYEDRL